MFKPKKKDNKCHRTISFSDLKDTYKINLNNSPSNFNLNKDQISKVPMRQHDWK